MRREEKERREKDNRAVDLSSEPSSVGEGSLSPGQRLISPPSGISLPGEQMPASQLLFRSGFPSSVLMSLSTPQPPHFQQPLPVPQRSSPYSFLCPKLPSLCLTLASTSHRLISDTPPGRQSFQGTRLSAVKLPFASGSMSSLSLLPFLSYFLPPLPEPSPGSEIHTKKAQGACVERNNGLLCE